MPETSRAWIYMILGAAPAAIAWVISLIAFLVLSGGFLSRGEVRLEAIKAIAWAFLIVLMASAGSWGFIRASQQPPSSTPSNDVLKTCLLLIFSAAAVAPLAIDATIKNIRHWKEGRTSLIDYGSIPLMILSLLVFGYLAEALIAWLRSRA
jgi:hypothetical protein